MVLGQGAGSGPTTDAGNLTYSNVAAVSTLNIGTTAGQQGTLVLGGQTSGSISLSVTPGVAAGTIIFPNASGTVALANTTAAGFVQTAPSAAQTITGAQPLIIDTGTLAIGSATAATLPLEIHSTTFSMASFSTHNNTNFQAPAINIARSHGTQASPTAVSSGDTLGYLSWQGYDGSAYGNGAQFVSFANSTFTTSNHFAALSLQQTASGSAGASETFRWNDANGNHDSGLSLLVLSGKVLGFNGSALGPPRTAFSESASNLMALGNGTNANSTGGLLASSFRSGGTKFTLSANACSADTTLGGGTAGSFISRTSGVCTVTILMGDMTTAATNGWHCSFEDHTTPANFLSQTGAADTTHCSMTGTTVTGDLVSFNAIGY